MTQATIDSTPQGESTCRDTEAPASSTGTREFSIRTHEIDGIRGWAALAVMVVHTFGEMLKNAVPATQQFLPAFIGDLAVGVFFVLSGDALSIAFFSGGGKRAIDRLLVRRYVRLTVPIVISCAMTYLIMITGADFHSQASVILGRPDWLGSFLDFSPNFPGFLKYSLIGVYVEHTPSLSYGPFLWTMSIEMVGSMLVFLLCYLWPSLRQPQKVCAALALALTILCSYYGLFFAGVLFGYWRRQGVLSKLAGNRSNFYCAILASIAAIAGLTIFRTNLHADIDLRRFATAVTAIIAVYSCYTIAGAKTFFSNRLSRELGELSFPLYLVHFQVLISLMSWLVVRNYRHDTISQSLYLEIALLSTVASILVAWCFRQVERAALRFVDSRALRLL